MLKNFFSFLDNILSQKGGNKSELIEQIYDKGYDKRTSERIVDMWIRDRDHDMENKSTIKSRGTKNG